MILMLRRSCYRPACSLTMFSSSVHHSINNATAFHPPNPCPSMTAFTAVLHGGGPRRMHLAHVHSVTVTVLRLDNRRGPHTVSVPNLCSFPASVTN